MSKNTNPFVNPYKGTSGTENEYRLTSSIPRSEYERIKFCRLASGTVEITVNLLWQKLINALNERNITQPTDTIAFEQFVANCVITDGGGRSAESHSRLESHAGTAGLPGVAASIPHTQAATPDERRGTEGPNHKVAVASGVDPESQSGTRTRGGRGGRQGGPKATKKKGLGVGDSNE